MLKRFLIALVVTLIVSGGYYYYLESSNAESAGIEDVSILETASGTSKSSTPKISGGEPTAAVDFSLTDQNGNKVTNQNLVGKKLLVFFGFTDCPDVCPVSMAVLSEVMNQLDESKAKDIQPVFVSIDPKTDTPAKLKEFLKDYHPSFIALTGEQSEVDKVTKSFKVYAKIPDHSNHDETDDAPDHSNLIYYMDKDGKYISHFTNDNAPEDIVDFINSH